MDKYREYLFCTTVVAMPNGACVTCGCAVEECECEEREDEQIDYTELPELSTSEV